MIDKPKTLKMQAEEAYQQGDLDGAEQLFRCALANIELAVGDDSFEVARILHCLSRVLSELGRTEEAARNRERADKILCENEWTEK